MKNLFPFNVSHNLLILTVFFSLGVLFSLKSVWLSREILVSAEINAEKPFVSQIFYTEKKGEKFNQKQSVKYNVPVGKSRFSIKLPVSKLWSFRFDFGNAPATVEIKNLSLTGTTTIPLDFNVFSYNQYISKHTIKEGNLTIISTGKDPFIVYKNPLNLTGRNVVDWYLLIILSCFFFFVFETLFSYLSKFKTAQNKSIIDIIFLSLFFSLSFIPMMHISDATKSETENRALAKKPHLNANGGGLNNFGDKFNDWFSDRFFGRSFLLGIHQKLNAFVAGKAGTEKVFTGKDGWLFYRLDNSPANYANRVILSEEYFKRALAYLKDLNDWCKKNGKLFYFFIAPDKNKIYGEYYPDFIRQLRSDDFSLGHQLIKYIRSNSDITAIYPYEELIANKNKGLLYYKHDTHWNDLGAYIGYQSLMRSMEISPDEYRFDTLSDKKRFDLENMYPDYPKDLTTYYTASFELKKYCDVNKDEYIHCTNPQAQKKVFMLRDSFTMALYPFMAPHFKEMFIYKRRNITSKDLKLISDNNVDIVILEIVERYSPHLNISFPKE